MIELLIMSYFERGGMRLLFQAARTSLFRVESILIQTGDCYVLTNRSKHRKKYDFSS